MGENLKTINTPFLCFLKTRRGDGENMRWQFCNTNETLSFIYFFPCLKNSTTPITNHTTMYCSPHCKHQLRLPWVIARCAFPATPLLPHDHRAFPVAYAASLRLPCCDMWNGSNMLWIKFMDGKCTS